MRIAVLALAAALVVQPALAQPTATVISPDRLTVHVKALADPKLAGRAPGGPGEAATVDYIVAQFKGLGLTPAGENGGWTQAVPLLRFQVRPDAKFSLTTGGAARPLTQAKDLMVWTQRPVDRVQVAAAPLVFVGYGVTAPERGWDDFKGYDLTGKIAVFLVNDPDFEAAPGDPVAGKFGGQAETYYGRWTYKFEEAARRGALGALVIHETAGAAYPWSTVVASNGDSYDTVRADPAKEKPLIQGWIQRELAVDLFAKSGLDFEVLKKVARTASFKPVELSGETLSADFTVKVDKVVSQNLLAKLVGGKRPEESVMFAAHWDAFGIGPPDATGDTVRHGAADDALGVAGVIELARALSYSPRTERTLVFAVWTAEERGLLGSEYYAAHPILPLATTAANLTMDTLQTAGPARDVVLIGSGQNALDTDLAKAAAAQHRTVTPDGHPERGLNFRADHFSVAKRGVPTLILMGTGGGHDLVAGGREAGEAWVNDYTTRCYHQVCDNWSPAWDLRGAAADVALFYDLGQALANSTRWPDWNAASEFKPIRAQTAAARR